MKIFIVGAGEVGVHIASSLARENHDLVVIERDSKKVSSMQSSMDILAVAGDGCDPGLLRANGVDEADLFFAVSNDDAANLRGKADYCCWSSNGRHCCRRGTLGSCGRLGGSRWCWRSRRGRGGGGRARRPGQLR